MSASMGPEEKLRRPVLVELKHGKVLFQQKCISFEKQSETLQEIVQFREMLDERIKQRGTPLTVIPDEHLPLIAKLAHESDKTLAVLSKHIRQELLPNLDDEEGDSTSIMLTIFPVSVVENAIRAIMDRNNYGLDGISGGRAPAAVCVWRWEVKEQHRNWLPKNAREKSESRLAERLKAKHDLLALFESLPQEEKDVILDPKGTNKLPQKELNVAGDLNASVHIPEEKLNSKKQKAEKSGEENDSSPKTSGTKARDPKPLDTAKAIKEQEKLERKAAKAEKEKKEKDAQDKSRSLMANFFGKQKKVPPQTPLKIIGSTAAGPSSSQSEFDRSFKPFVLKKDAELAPINWFHGKRRSSSMKVDDEIIVIDGVDGDVETLHVKISPIDVTRLSASDHLHSIISSLFLSAGSRSYRRLARKHFPRLKTYNPLSVRDIYSQLSEAEVAGDDVAVRSCMAQLNDRTRLPAKVFIFSEDARPGYFGTWTRNSRIIGARTPFAKDVLVFDYGYDSGEEWEEEPAGDADDVADEGEDEEDGEEPDSDLDSWLEDDDDEQSEVTLWDLDRLSPGPELPNLPTKRKAEDGERKLAKKRKVVIPLVPFAKGPYWETPIGQCPSMFDTYKIQLFNDTPLPINPFTFISTCVEDSKQDVKTVSQSKPVLMNDGVFVVPNLPDHLSQSSATTPGSNAASPSTIPPSGPVKKLAGPKTPFPNVHIPFLLDQITSLQTASLTFLVEAVYRELREHKVKKNMIEAKVREVAEKCKQKKFWTVKSGIQVET